MNRRKALINLGIISGGLVLLSSCEFSKEKVSLALNNLNINKSQESLLKEIIETMLPGGEIPGAIELKVDEFVWVMVDDCMEKKQQDDFLTGLNSFGQMSNKERKVIFKSLEEHNSEDQGSLDKRFIQTVKQLAVFGFMESEYIMTEVMPYSLVPGKYGTCETIDPTKRINING